MSDAANTGTDKHDVVVRSANPGWNWFDYTCFGLSVGFVLAGIFGPLIVPLLS